MKPLPLTRELIALAERLLPEMRPRDVLDRPHELLAQAVKQGNTVDVALLSTSARTL